ncbi:MerR family transcriptional regulator [bacterium]|nr:MerR family transcriptional regulator [bacterium]
MKDPGKYQIKAVCRLTGLSPDVIRAWERRYAAIAPVRAERNLRLYSEGDVARLLLLKQATAAGHAIGRIASLSDADLSDLVATPEPLPVQPQGVLAQRIIDAVDRLDYLAADEALGHAALVLPPVQLIHEVVLPLLEHVGSRWSHRSLGIAAEHLATSLLRSLLGTILRTRHLDRRHAPVLLGTLPGELHEMGLLVVALMVASCGVPVCYLGPNLPPSELALAAKRIGAFAVGISLVTHPDDARLSALETLAGALEPGTRLWLGGQGISTLPARALPRQAIVLPTLLEVERHLKVASLG